MLERLPLTVRKIPSSNNPGRDIEGYGVCYTRTIAHRVLKMLPMQGEGRVPTTNVVNLIFVLANYGRVRQPRPGYQHGMLNKFKNLGDLAKTFGPFSRIS